MWRIGGNPAHPAIVTSSSVTHDNRSGNNGPQRRREDGPGRNLGLLVGFLGLAAATIRSLNLSVAFWTKRSQSDRLTALPLSASKTWHSYWVLLGGRGVH